jgi:hypothetical protein
MIFTDSPLHVEIVPTLVPVAETVQEQVRIEVRAEEVVYPKREDSEQLERGEQSLIKKCENILDYMYWVSNTYITWISCRIVFTYGMDV